MTIEDGIFEVTATAGDTHLGTEDFDNQIVLSSSTQATIETDALLDGAGTLSFSKAWLKELNMDYRAILRVPLRDAVATAASTSAVCMMSSTLVVLLEVPSRRI